jgi:hypothetical protein
MAEDINAPVRKTDSRFDEWLFQFWAKYQSLQRVGRAIAALTNGIVVKTGDETFTSRTITGTANQITVTNGDGVAANPTLSIPTTLIAPGSVEVTTDLSVDGDTQLGETSDDSTYITGPVGIGTAPATTPQFVNRLPITGGVVGQALLLDGVIQPDVTSIARYSNVVIMTAASPFTVTDIFGYRVSQGTLGAGSSVTRLYGFRVDASLIGGASNFGVSSAIPTGANRWNIYSEGSAPNYFAGNTMFSNPSTQQVFFNTTNVTPKVQVLGTDSSSSGILSYRASANNAASFIALAKSRGAAVGTNTIVQADDQLGRVSFLGADGTNYVPAGWIQGEVDGTPGTNDMPGRIVFYTTADGSNSPTERLRISSNGVSTVTGSIVATASITSSGQTSGVGYSTGAGSTVTQATSKATGVTLNRVCGQITMNNAALNPVTAVTFTLTNSAIATTDVVIVNIDSGATANSYTATVSAVGAGSCDIQLYNFTAGILSEAVVLNFAVIKSVTS